MKIIMYTTALAAVTEKLKYKEDSEEWKRLNNLIIEFNEGEQSYLNDENQYSAYSIIN